MRVIPVPKEVSVQGWVTGTSVFSSPSGDLTDPVIPPAEGLRYLTRPSGAEEGTIWPAVGVVLLLEEADLEQIHNGARHLLMGWPGEQMPVFMVPEIFNLEELPLFIEDARPDDQLEDPPGAPA